ncbi:16S rRNA (adenine(1518)-N(6)/adenine(1519)-N(6))-dimethyltransferase RsmA [Puniceicoccus vermicola]|uniref:Ribosomal RNA small subunit methyltransferase A n=1 Tax=Puniceicoccus vermicola TaxID=388746 RepID=A0A7X1E678_9BACT|nr:16S rRNA (adenine(1518)-N(6)/adenine(1519)-N(6))-dimethyltransferase RsmA [Puniceicoccus vermicola]MBC2603876.1 ribosomal RNA small subunit methyltransferase A [Puniceicoccus vermicola]
MSADSPSRVRAILDELEIRPEKRLGQNFLCDGNWIRKAVESLPSELPVVEVGPGIGALTEATLDRGHEVWAVEVDARLCRYLSEKFSDRPFHLLEADAVSQPLGDFPETNSSFALLSNLPFAITSPWLDSLLKPERSLPDFVALILQKEGMDRTMARPGEKTYGPTAIRMTLAYEFQTSFNVPRSAFHPQPTIESRFGTWVRQECPRLLSGAAVTLLRQFFGQRRKMIRQGMKQWLEAEEAERWTEALTQNNLAPTARAEEIPPKLWWKLLEG